MTRRLTLPALLLFFVVIQVFAQEQSELDKKNGFKDIQLGMMIDSIHVTEFKKDILEKGEFPAKLYVVTNDNVQSIGEVKVKRVEIKTYKDMIYEIDVYTVKDTRLMKGMVRSYGQPKYILTTDTYNWLGENLSLTFKAHTKKEIKLTYRSFPLIKMMFADKGKKIDAIADDF